MGLDYGWRYAQKWWYWEFEDFERVIEFSTVEVSGWVFRIWSVQIIFSDLEQRRWIEILKNHKVCRAFGGGVSIV